MDAIREVGPGSHYLGCAHTQANFETAFYRSSIADNNSFEQWLSEGEQAGRPAGQRDGAALARHLRGAAARSGIDEALQEFMAKRKASMPDAFT